MASLQPWRRAFGVRTAGLRRLGGRVVEQCQQQVFDRHELMPGLTGALVARPMVCSRSLLNMDYPAADGNNMRPDYAISITLADCCVQMAL